MSIRREVRPHGEMPFTGMVLPLNERAVDYADEQFLVAEMPAESPLLSRPSPNPSLRLHAVLLRILMDGQ
ncbi:hypothetical protein GCM10022222_06610 [Amycolatopsis ultiminotia]|uniref:Uncharacterized protein n=1 Tax=Amycolatopsis ultiminotia TaxID=543629 RepID=A0ABP6V564_9PSEU